MRRLWLLPLLATLAASACTGDGDGGASATTTSTTPRSTSTIRPIGVNPALQPQTRDLELDENTSWTAVVRVDTAGPAPQFCVSITFTYFTASRDRSVCGVKPELDMFEGPALSNLRVFFGAVANDATRVRVYDKVRDVVDLTPQVVGTMPFRVWVAVVPIAYQPDRASAFDADKKLLRTAELRAG